MQKIFEDKMLFILNLTNLERQKLYGLKIKILCEEMIFMGSYFDNWTYSLPRFKTELVALFLAKLSNIFSIHILRIIKWYHMRRVASMTLEDSIECSAPRVIRYHFRRKIFSIPNSNNNSTIVLNYETWRTDMSDKRTDFASSVPANGYISGSETACDWCHACHIDCGDEGRAAMTRNRPLLMWVTFTYSSTLYCVVCRYR